MENRTRWAGREGAHGYKSAGSAGTVHLQSDQGGDVVQTADFVRVPEKRIHDVTPCPALRLQPACLPSPA